MRDLYPDLFSSVNFPRLNFCKWVFAPIFGKKTPSQSSMVTNVFLKWIVQVSRFMISLHALSKNINVKIASNIFQ